MVERSSCRSAVFSNCVLVERFGGRRANGCKFMYERLCPCLAFVERLLQFPLPDIRNSRGCQRLGSHCIFTSDVKCNLLASRNEIVGNNICAISLSGNLPFQLGRRKDDFIEARIFGGASPCEAKIEGGVPTNQDRCDRESRVETNTKPPWGLLDRANEKRQTFGILRANSITGDGHPM